jgi:Flp pilus assembly protein TadD
MTVSSKSTTNRPMMSAARLAVTAALLALLAACGSTPVQEPPSPATPEPEASPPPAPAKTPDRGDPQQRFNAALEQMKTGDVQAAERSLMALTHDFPQFPGPWIDLGIVYAKSKRPGPAMDAFGHATQLDPSNVVAWNWLGILNRQAGQYDRARLAYERGLQVAPNDAMTRLNYAILLDVYLKQPLAAIEQYKQYESQTPKEDLAVMAWVAELEARYKTAARTAASSAPGATPAPPSEKAP